MRPAHVLSYMASVQKRERAQLPPRLLRLCTRLLPACCFLMAREREREGGLTTQMGLLSIPGLPQRDRVCLRERETERARASASASARAKARGRKMSFSREFRHHAPLFSKNGTSTRPHERQRERERTEKREEEKRASEREHDSAHERKRERARETICKIWTNQFFDALLIQMLAAVHKTNTADQILGTGTLPTSKSHRSHHLHHIRHTGSRMRKRQKRPACMAKEA